MVSLQIWWCKDLVEYHQYAVSYMCLIVLLFPIYRFFNLMLLVDVLQTQLQRRIDTVHHQSWKMLERKKIAQRKKRYNPSLSS